MVLLQKMTPTMINWYTSGAAYVKIKEPPSEELESLITSPSVKPKMEAFLNPETMVQVESGKEGFEIKTEFDKDDIESEISTMPKEGFEKCNPDYEVPAIKSEFISPKMLKDDFEKCNPDDKEGIIEEKAQVPVVKNELISPIAASTVVSTKVSPKKEFSLLQHIKEEYDSKPLAFFVPKIEPIPPSNRESMIILRYESSKSLKRKILSDSESPNFKKSRIEFKVEPKSEKDGEFYSRNEINK